MLICSVLSHIILAVECVNCNDVQQTVDIQISLPSVIFVVNNMHVLNLCCRHHHIIYYDVIYSADIHLFRRIELFPSPTFSNKLQFKQMLTVIRHLSAKFRKWSSIKDVHKNVVFTPFLPPCFFSAFALLLPPAVWMSIVLCYRYMSVTHHITCT